MSLAKTPLCEKSLSPVVQSTSPVHQSSPAITDSLSLPSVAEWVYCSIDYTKGNDVVQKPVYPISSTVILIPGLDCEWQANSWVRHWLTVIIKCLIVLLG